MLNGNFCKIMMDHNPCMSVFCVNYVRAEYA